jgi:hypothetical protein
MFKGVLATDLDETDVLGAMPFSIAKAAPTVDVPVLRAPPMQAGSTTGIRWFLILLILIGAFALVSWQPDQSTPSGEPTIAPTEPVVEDRRPARAAATSPTVPAANRTPATKPSADVRVESEAAVPDAADEEPVDPSLPASDVVPPGVKPQHIPPDLQLLRDWQRGM